MNIGETIRSLRLRQGLSQGDIERHTGLLRCYLSRVENGHTIPSIDTLAKIATAVNLPLVHFFDENSTAVHPRQLPPLGKETVRFLSEIRQYSPNLNESDRKIVIAMIKKMATISTK